MKCQKTGFVLVETLIVSVFIMTLLAALYANLFPVVAEYEKRTNYDSVSAKYVAHWARKMILDKGRDNIYTLVDGYLDITDCSYYSDATFCTNYKNANQVNKIYITPYSLTTFKNYVKTSGRFDRGFEEYIASLPDYPSKAGVYRVIVEIVDQENAVTSYGTIEVKK